VKKLLFTFFLDEQMKDSINPYSFRDVDSNDFQLLASWLNEPKVLRWFDDPEYLESLAENLEDNRIRMQLVLHNNELTLEV